jgi:hypothetical protein
MEYIFILMLLFWSFYFGSQQNGFMHLSGKFGWREDQQRQV